MSNNEFIDLVKDAVYEVCLDGRIMPSILIAHAAILSNWGKSDIAINANNLYNVQCPPLLVGESYVVNDTINTITGKSVNNVVHYRVYSSWKESVIDYIERIMIKPKYDELIHINNIDECVSTYSRLTDKSNKALPLKLMKLIRKYSLTQYDIVRGKHNPYNIAQIGDKGELVRWLQYELMIRGYKGDGFFITSFYDYQTMLAVKDYQKNNNIDPSGIVDLKTLKTLISS